MKALRTRQRPDQLGNDIRKPRRSFGKFLYALLLLGLAGWAFLAIAGGRYFFSAKAQILRERVLVEAGHPIRVVKVWVQPGDSVAAGAPLFTATRLDLREKIAGLQMQLSVLEQSEADFADDQFITAHRLPVLNQEVERLEAEFARSQTLGSKGLGTATRIDDVAGALAQARDALAQARARVDAARPSRPDLDRLRLEIAELEAEGADGLFRAPVGGIVGPVLTEPGSVAASGDLLAEVFTGPAYALLYLPTDYGFALAPGQEVVLARGAETQKGVVAARLDVSGAPPPGLVGTFGSPGPFRLARIALGPEAGFAVGQVVDVQLEGEPPPKAALRALAKRVQRSVTTFLQQG